MSFTKQNILSDSKINNLINQNNYAATAEHLFNSQLNSWELLRKNYDTLKNVQIKSFWFHGFKIKIQYNPERMKSTAAEVDEESVANRKCFLCINNLPQEQKGIIIRDKFFLLCNPYPIFPQHFTISSLKHEPQRINKNLKELLELTKLLAPGYTLVYNGPACGASAPDHLHFQVGTKLFMPIEGDIQQMKNNYGKLVFEDDKISVSFINDGMRRLIFIESDKEPKINRAFKKIFDKLKSYSVNSTEAMMNIICRYNIESGWSIVMFLRRKHRPKYFYSKEPEKILVSPAAIDLGGVMVTPRYEDFAKMEEDLVQDIFDEVSLDKDNFSSLTKKLRKAFN